MRPSSVLAPALASALALLAACAPSRRVHPRAAEEIAAGYRHLQAGDLERAEVAFGHALEFNEDLPEALNGAGLVERRRQRLEAARRHYEHAVKVAPDFAEARVNLGELALAEGRPEAAEAAFRAALAIDPDLVPARLDLARALVKRGQAVPAERPAAWAEARRQYLHLLETKPLPEAYSELGFIAYRSGDYAEAEAEYRRASELAPDFAEAQHGLCIARVRLGRCSEGAAACRRCLSLAPAEERCRVSLQGALACAGARP
jgi:Flp pilus assembly protein TadD